MLSFSTAEFFGGGSFNIINFLLPGFLALVIGLPPALAGLVMFTARIVDAVIDPPIGLLSDWSRVRLGSRRGPLLAFSPFIVLTLFLTFYPSANPSLTVRFWGVLLAYVSFSIVQSSVMIPYYSLASEATEDYTERSRLTSLRLGISIFASILCVALPGVVIDIFGGHRGYMVMSLLFGTIFTITVAITAIFAKEGIPAPKKVARFSRQEFFRPLKVRPFRQYLLLFLCVQLTMAVMSALFFFYIDFYFAREATARGESTMIGLVAAAILFGMQIVALPIYLRMMKKHSKTTAYTVGSVIWIVGAILLFFMPADISPVFLYLLAAMLGFGISGPGLVPHALLPDVIDAGQLQFGKRTAGAFSGLSNLFIQISQAAGIAIVMALIGAAGFVEANLAAGDIITAQPTSAQTAIRLILMATPILFMSIGIFAASRYRLNGTRHKALLEALDGTDAEKEAVLREL